MHFIYNVTAQTTDNVMLNTFFDDDESYQLNII